MVILGIMDRMETTIISRDYIGVIFRALIAQCLKKSRTCGRFHWKLQPKELRRASTMRFRVSGLRFRGLSTAFKKTWVLFGSQNMPKLND